MCCWLWPHVVTIKHMHAGESETALVPSAPRKTDIPRCCSPIPHFLRPGADAICPLCCIILWGGAQLSSTEPNHLTDSRAMGLHAHRIMPCSLDESDLLPCRHHSAIYRPLECKPVVINVLPSTPAGPAYSTCFSRLTVECPYTLVPASVHTLTVTLWCGDANKVDLSCESVRD